MSGSQLAAQTAVARTQVREAGGATDGVGRREERLDGEEDGADLEGGRPLVLENVEADAPKLV